MVLYFLKIMGIGTMNDTRPAPKKESRLKVRVAIILVALIAALAAAGTLVFAVKGVGWDGVLASKRVRVLRMEKRTPGGPSLFLASMGAVWNGFLDWPEIGVAAPLKGLSAGKGFEFDVDQGGQKHLKVQLYPLSSSGGGKYSLALAQADRGNTSSNAPQKHVETVLEVDAKTVLEVWLFYWRGEAGKAKSDTVASLLAATKADWPPEPPKDTSDGQRYLVLSALRSGDRTLSAVVDDRLRRGASAQEYASRRLASLTSSSDRPGAPKSNAHGGKGSDIGLSAWGSSFIESQVPVFLDANVLSVRTERCIIDSARQVQTSFYTTIDLSSGKAMRLGDLFAGGRAQDLGRILNADAAQALAANFSGDLGKASGTPALPPDLRAFGLFDASLAPSEDFFVCRTGVGFHYDVYRLAPANFGDFTFIVPWGELGPLLTDRFRTLAGL